MKIVISCFIFVEYTKAKEQRRCCQQCSTSSAAPALRCVPTSSSCRRRQTPDAVALCQPRERGAVPPACGTARGNCAVLLACCLRCVSTSQLQHTAATASVWSATATGNVCLYVLLWGRVWVLLSSVRVCLMFYAAYCACCWRRHPAGIRKRSCLTNAVNSRSSAAIHSFFCRAFQRMRSFQVCM